MFPSSSVRPVPLISRSLCISSTQTRRTNDRHYLMSDPLPVSKFQISDTGTGFASSCQPKAPLNGPLSEASPPALLTPILLKQHLDKYIVGQNAAKKATSVAVFNHYQRIRELRRLKYQEQSQAEQLARERMRGEDSRVGNFDTHGRIETVDLNSRLSRARAAEAELDLTSASFITPDPRITTIEKSNLLLLGPSGVGKTYLLSTLARTLSVPFTTVDCSTLTQAGYIGSDIESSIERLLLAANCDVQRCEEGIVFFDEVDKLAKPAVVTHGRDVSGEGVQQGLLKLIEGTTVTVSVKSDRTSKSEKAGREGSSNGKGEQYTVDTTNILFVFAGAFIGLERIISSRLSTGNTIGFTSSSSSISTPIRASSSPKCKNQQTKRPKNTLASVSSSDLRSYGLIPELLGRIPLTIALSPLSLHDLIAILTEPRDSLVKQYIALFATYGIKLHFSTGALYAIAERALPPEIDAKCGDGSGTGARALRSIMESVLGEIMYRGPGSSVRYVLVDERYVRDLQSENTDADMDLHGDTDASTSHMPRCWSRVERSLFEDAIMAEESTAQFSCIGESERPSDMHLGPLSRIGGISI